MTPPTRREHIAAILERDREGYGGGLGMADRRYLLGVVGELAAALRLVVDLWDDTVPDPWDVDRDVLEPAQALLADLGPDE